MRPARQRAVQWTRADDAEFPYQAQVDGHQWVIRINDFPVDEFKYSLLVDGKEAESFNDWPAGWVKPQAARSPRR